MRLLALDQASRISGYSVFIDDKLVDYGTFELEGDDVGARLVQIEKEIDYLVKKYDITDLAFEDVLLSANIGNNVQTLKVLAEVLGVVHKYAAENKLKYEIIPATSWKYGIGLKTKKRADQKKEAQEFALNKYGIKTNQDTADAIGIGTYYLKKNESAF